MILLVLVFALKFVFPRDIPIACVCACIASEDHVYMTYMFNRWEGGGYTCTVYIVSIKVHLVIFVHKY